MLPKPDLVLFTVGFPYGGSESVLLSELEVTAERFRRVYLVPPHRGGDMVEVPPNAVVVDLGWGSGWSREEKLRVLRSSLAYRVIASALRRHENRRPYLAGARAYLDILATNLLRARTLEQWVRGHGLDEAIFYDYWFENSTLALSVLRYLGVIRCAVSRAHRFDVFDSSWGDLGRVPFREFKARHLDAIFAISQDGASYLSERLDRDRNRVHVSRLGLPLPRSFPPADGDKPLILSCSSLTSRKQVNLIPEVLRACNRPLRWVHFGDGPERAEVESRAETLGGDVSWELRGAVPNTTVREFYATHRVSAFLSLSTSEGIPVSMMEAQSFGLPVVARAVGGIPELVTPQTGVLVHLDASVPDLARALTGAITPSAFDPAVIRSAFAARFSAATNYGLFGDALINLWSKRGGEYALDASQ